MKSLLITLSLLASPAFAADCPREIVLTAPHFLGGAEYPSDAQIETNFRQTFRTQGFRTYDDDELHAAQHLVRTLAANTSGHILTLRTFGRNLDGDCAGALAGEAFTVDAQGVNFVLGEISSLTIGFGNHVPATYILSLPSNCSGCARETELFEVSTVQTK